mgnify:CR=1 FL=1
MSHWVMGILSGAAALCGLFMAGAAQDGAIFWFGLGLVGFGTLFSWFMIKVAFDEAEAGGFGLAEPVDPGQSRAH